MKCRIHAQVTVNRTPVRRRESKTYALWEGYQNSAISTTVELRN